VIFNSQGKGPERRFLLTDGRAVNYGTLRAVGRKYKMLDLVEEDRMENEGEGVLEGGSGHRQSNSHPKY